MRYLRVLFALAALTILPSLACAQGNTVTTRSTDDPTGDCAFVRLWINSNSGDIFYCPDGTWELLASGSGAIGGSGTANTIAKFTAAALIGNSNVTDDGTTVTVGGTNFKFPGAAGAAPTTEGLFRFNTTNDRPVWGDGSTTQTGLSAADVPAITSPTDDQLLVYQTTSPATITTTGNVSISTIGLTIDGGGSAITTGVKGDIRVPFACTINDWYLLADQSGSIVIDVWKDTYANFPPTDADSIAGSELPTLSSVDDNRDTALSTWTTTVATDSIFRFNVDSATTVTRVNLTIKCTRTTS